MSVQGCPEPVWDGPYKMECGRTLVDGVCGRHGKVRSASSNRVSTICDCGRDTDGQERCICGRPATHQVVRDSIPKRAFPTPPSQEARSARDWQGNYVDDPIPNRVPCPCEDALLNREECPNPDCENYQRLHSTRNRVRAEDFTHSFLMCEKTGELACNTKSPPQPFCPTHRTGGCLRIYVPLSEVQDG